MALVGHARRAVLRAPFLPRATAYTVTIPAGTHALDGTKLDAPYTFHFSTAPPVLSAVGPKEGADHLAANAELTLHFTQPVDLAEVRRATSLTAAGAPSPIAFSAKYRTAADATTILLTPDAPLPLASSFHLHVDASLRGTEGPLPLGSAHDADFSTYGPLLVKDTACWRPGGDAKHRCPLMGDPGTYKVTLSNAVPLRDLASHVRIDPPVPIEWPKYDAAARGSSFNLPARVRADTHYRVAITAGLRDQYGQKLARDFHFDLVTGDARKESRIETDADGERSSSSLFEPGATPRVNVRTRNATYVDVATETYDPADLVDVVTGMKRAYERGADRPRAKVARVFSKGPRNELQDHPVPWGDLFPHGKRGVAGVFTRAVFERDGTPGSQREPEENMRILSSTDLEISAHFSRYGSVVWVTHLSTGAPVDHATVSVFTRGKGEVASITTGPDGTAILPVDRYAPLIGHPSPYGPILLPDTESILVVRSKEDWAYQHVSGMANETRMPINVGTILIKRAQAFTDRGVYRPGETVHGALFARTEEEYGMTTPEGLKVHVAAEDAKGQTFFESDETLDRFGGATFEFVLPPVIAFGDASVVVSSPGTPFGSEPAGFKVASYRPVELTVDVEARAQTLTRGDVADFRLAGKYLFGAPVSGGKVHSNVTRARASFAPVGHADLVTNDFAYADFIGAHAPPSDLKVEDGPLAADGSRAAQLPLVLADQYGAETVTFEAEVTDPARQTVAGRTAILVHPGRFYLGLARFESCFLRSGESVRPEVLAVAPAGTVLPGVNVHLEAIRHEPGAKMGVVMSSCDVVTGAAPASCELRADRGGEFIVRATTHDDRGDPLGASSLFYALGAGSPRSLPSAARPATAAPPLAIRRDKESYVVGDTASLLVESPFAHGRALVTVERNGIEWEETQDIDGPSAVVSIPITEKMRPNAFVTVHLIAGRSKPMSEAPGDGAPGYRLATTNLVVSPESQRLHVDVTPRARDYTPGDEVDVAVAVQDHAGAPKSAEVAFYAVDEGILALTGYRTPDLLPTFTAQRTLTVWRVESRDELPKPLVKRRGGPQEEGEMMALSGHGGIDMPAPPAAPRVRSDFTPTPLFTGRLVTGADGAAHARFKLPDSVSAFRLIAVAAAQDNEFGSADATVTTSRRLMVRPALPRFLRAGDTMDAGVIVTSKAAAEASVAVSLAATGVTVEGDATRVVRVPARGEVEVRWHVTAPASGEARFTFSAKSRLSPNGAKATNGADEDSVVVARTVAPALEPEVVALAGETEDRALERVGALRAIRPEVGGLDLKLASTSLVGIGDAAAQLLAPVYRSAEEDTSRLFALLPLRPLALEYGMAVPADADALVTETIATLLRRQRNDGGFGYWADSTFSDPWLSAYALWGLTSATHAGANVPAAAIENATRYVAQELKVAAPTPLEIGAAAQTLMLDVLAELGQFDPAAATRLYEARAGLPLFARALLVHALTIAKGDPTQRDELRRDLEAHLRVSPTRVTVAADAGATFLPILDSEARTTAIVLRALVSASPRSPLLAPLARALVASRKSGHWRSTQETAWALLALDDYRRGSEAPTARFDARVELDGHKLLEHPFRDHEDRSREEDLHLPTSAIGAGGGLLSFAMKGTGELFYEAKLTYAKNDLPTTPLERGFFVSKRVRVVPPGGSPDAVPATASLVREVQSGDVVVVDVDVFTAAARDHVAITDPLPAGLEAVDSTFETASTRLRVFGQNPRDAEGWLRDERLHEELRDDRALGFIDHMPAGITHFRYVARATTSGTFLASPTRAECMYEPEVFGRTAGGTFVVHGH